MVLTAHAQLRKFSQPDELGEYDRWELKLGKKTGSQISPLIKEWADLLLFANYKTFAVATDKDGKKFKAQGGARVMYTEHHPCWDAKNRFGLKPELKFDFSEIAHLFHGTVHGNKYYYDKNTNEVSKGTAPEGAFEISEEDYAAVTETKKQLAEAKTKEQTAQTETPADTLGEKPKPDFSGLPKELSALMSENNVTEEEIRRVVASKHYYTEATPLEKYDPKFIKGVLIGAWNEVFASICEQRELDNIPF